MQTSPPVSTKQKPHPNGWGFLFGFDGGREPISMELSGGQFLPPVQKLVATYIYLSR